MPILKCAFSYLTPTEQLGKYIYVAMKTAQVEADHIDHFSQLYLYNTWLSHFIH